MSRRRYQSRKVSDIASKRISILFGLSRKALENGDRERAQRYVILARRISQKNKTPIPRGERYCKKCNLPLDAGRNCRVRVAGGNVKITCLMCGDIRRVPYSRS